MYGTRNLVTRSTVTGILCLLLAVIKLFPLDPSNMAIIMMVHAQQPLDIMICSLDELLAKLLRSTTTTVEEPRLLNISSVLSFPSGACQSSDYRVLLQTILAGYCCWTQHLGCLHIWCTLCIPCFQIVDIHCITWRICPLQYIYSHFDGG